MGFKKRGLLQFPTLELQAKCLSFSFFFKSKSNPSIHALPLLRYTDLGEEHTLQQLHYRVFRKTTKIAFWECILIFPLSPLHLF